MRGLTSASAGCFPVPHVAPRRLSPAVVIDHRPVTSLSELQFAIDQHATACWFAALTDRQRHWEDRQDCADIVARARDYAINCGANADQLLDCEQYGTKLALSDRVPLTLSGRTWDQFAADVGETC